MSAPPCTLDRAQIPDAARTLARALACDPGWIAILPGAHTRARRLEGVLAAALARVYVPLGASSSVGADGDAIAAVAIWAPPGRHGIPLLGALRAAPGVAWRLRGRVVVAAQMMLAMERGHPTEPHHYLAFLGVDPAHQGRGLGPRLLAPVLDRCDAERTLAWLESTNPKNHAFYRRLGFEVADQRDFATGVTMTFFARRPR